MPSTIAAMTVEIRENNIAKGWRDPAGGPGDNTLGDYIALLHTEVAEAIEEYRDHRLADATKPVCGRLDRPSARRGWRGRGACRLPRRAGEARERQRVGGDAGRTGRCRAVQVRRVMTPQQAWGGHCTSGGTIASGAAVCQCGLWAAADHPDAESRKAGRKQHLAEVLAVTEATKDDYWKGR